MKHSEWQAEAAAVRDEIARCYIDRATDHEFEMVTRREQDILAASRRYFRASDRGFVRIGAVLGKWFGPQFVVRVTIRDLTRFQETTYDPADDDNPLTSQERAEAWLVAGALRRWESGIADELPAGITREEAYAPWRESEPTDAAGR